MGAIREILRDREVGSQGELVRLLRQRGIRVTQSSVSRDLRSLPVGKVGGSYRLTGEGGDLNGAAADEELLRRTLPGAVTGVAPAGPHLLVIRTVPGTASRVGLVLDGTRWAEVVGTVAGDDTLFVACRTAPERRRLQERLAGILGRELEHG